MEPITLAEFKRIKWVQDAKKVDSGYKVKTRKSSLKTLLTHNIIDRGDGYGSSFDNRYASDTELPEPFSLELPQYWIHLRTRGFDFTFAKDPGVKADNHIGFTPTYQSLYEREKWMSPQGVCYGNADPQYDGRSMIDEYQAATNWKEKLVIAAMYLQSAKPHYGLTWYRTSYAVRLGLVGDEFFRISPQIEVRRQQAEEARRVNEEQARQRAAMVEQEIEANQQNNAPDTETNAVRRGFTWTGFIQGNN